ncbi:hypothetical protein C1637_09630 [Chryseobacterium lactis]|uniref:Uncharacterized protein n=1 Tax=Chryseobacterium lactis TaxID=1241981 RepID=A0A3G6RC24_CHRLC|nr:hypothetical protein [Chryseobacterium lactis]AZA82230.1 hypothetical protein EG342_10075 [Chryseobacterium lactis]AZB02611.1 hypothetical protein EG341_00930 [Chryseobacterium lactis]PNW14095.1 hypothetical protein C1637_09630 [Chryseobacterium lactis]
MKTKPLLITITFVLGILLAVFGIKFYQESNIEGYNLVNYPVQVVLPEDYKEISPESHLVGYYNERQNKLYIAFYNEHGKKINTNSTAKDTNEKH